jgi:hypothetical protein
MNIIPPISEGQCPSCACRLACWMRARFNDVDIISSVTCALSSSLVGGVSSWRCFCFEHCNGLKLNIDSLTVVYQKYWKYGAHNLQWNLKKKGSKSGAQNVQYASVPRWQSLLHNHLFFSLRKTERLSCPGRAQQRVDSCRAFFVMWRTTNAARYQFARQSRLRHASFIMFFRITQYNAAAHNTHAHSPLWIHVRKP